MLDGMGVQLPAISATAGRIGAAAADLSPAGPGTPAGIGHDGLAAALAGFEQRWSSGVQVLAHDVRRLVDGLDGTVSTYQAVEQSVVAALQPVDPGPPR